MDPALGSVYILKADVSNSLYRIIMQPIDATKLGLVFPLGISGEDLVPIPLTVPMGLEELPAYILHVYGDSHGSGECSPVLQPPFLQAQNILTGRGGSHTLLVSPISSPGRVEPQPILQMQKRESHGLSGRLFQ